MPSDPPRWQEHLVLDSVDVNRGLPLQDIACLKRISKHLHVTSAATTMCCTEKDQINRPAAGSIFSRDL